VAALPEAEQAAYLVSKLDGQPTVVDSERAAAALRGLARAAVDVLLPLLTVDGRAWRAAMLLAEIGRPDGDVVAGLIDALPPAGDGPAHRVVRRHAVDVLGERRLGPDVGARVLPRLAR
jgi:hypothetical protein